MATVRLTVVPAEAAELLCAALRAEGIQCAHVTTDVSAGFLGVNLASGGWREVLVDETQLKRARELHAAAETCVEEFALSEEEFEQLSADQLVKVIMERGSVGEAQAREAVESLRDALAESATSEPPTQPYEPERWEIVGVTNDDRYLIITSGDTPDSARARVFDGRIDELYPEAPLAAQLAQLDCVREPTLTNAERERILTRARAAAR